MKIIKQQSNNDIQSAKDFDMLIKDLINEHGNIFFAEIGNNVYVYKPIGRKKYKEIVLNPEISEIEKEDVICEECILYPFDFDVDDVEAGIPTELTAQILKNSFLETTEQMVSLIEVFREESKQLDIQMSCIISEAFPSFNMDEIESWDMMKFCKMYARAEWKLKNLRNIEFENDVINFLKNPNDTESDDDSNEQFNNINSINTNNKNNNFANINSNEEGIKVGNRIMSKEEYQQYLDFQRAHPEIDFGADTMFTGFDTMGYNSMPVALRPRNTI